MKKLLYSVAIALTLCGVYACDDDDNPGDFKLKSTLALGQFMAIDGNGNAKSGVELPALVVESEMDSTYRHFYDLKDTAGNVITDAEGNPQKGYADSKKTGHIYKMKLCTLPAKADTFRIYIKSNARWEARQPEIGTKKDGKPGVQWFFNYNSTSAGGGDSKVEFRTSRNRTKTRENIAYQYVVTSDSTVMYIIPFTQAGEKD